MAFPTLKARGGELHGFDFAQVNQAICLLADPEQGFQLQYAPFHNESFRTFQADFTDIPDWLDEHKDAKGVYYALNPVRPGLDHLLKNEDVLCRRNLLIDVDRAKTQESKHMAASAEEHEAARVVTIAIATWLAGKGWPAPIVIDSGNGWHLVIRICLPNDKLSQAIIRAFLFALADRFDCDTATIGKECHDARRIAKLPGCWARNKESEPARPHRLCCIVSSPAEMEVLAVELIQATTAALTNPQKEPERPRDEEQAFRFRAQNCTLDNKLYAMRALDSECSILSLAKHGELNDQLFKSAAAMGNFVPHLLSYKLAFDRLLASVNYAGADNPRKDEDTLNRGIQKGMETPRYAPAPAGTIPPEPDPPTDQPLIIRASEVTPRAVEWLWPATIPLGKLATFAGVGGLGKTFVLLDLAARVSRGSELPFCGGECAPLGQTLFISGEDDPEDTLVPRLIELGAHLPGISFLAPVARDRFDLAALKLLTAVIGQIGSDTRLVVIDPPSSFLAPGIDDHKNSDLRRLLTPLQGWAAEKRVAVIFNSHLNKAQGKVDAMMRVMGSAAWVNAVRAAHLFAKDPEDPERRFFVPMKMNLAKERSGLAYRIVASGTLAKVEWLKEIETTADEAVSPGSGEERKKRRPRREIAAEWLVGQFRKEREWESADLFRAGKAANISRSAIYEAKDLLNLPNARKTTQENGDIIYTWWVPANWEPLREAPSDETAKF
jgi:putative DNA primase/helicase